MNKNRNTFKNRPIKMRLQRFAEGDPVQFPGVGPGINTELNNQLAAQNTTGTQQIYQIVNDAIEESIGKSPALKIQDTGSLVTTGKLIQQQNYTEAFLNSLYGIIYRNIFAYRTYRNKLGYMVLADSEWGMFVRKISGQLPEMEEDPSTALVNGESVDMYIVNKPQIIQKMFTKRTPYSLHITTQRTWLKEAFSGPTELDAFLSMVYTLCRNSLEVGIEDLSRLCLANMIALSATREVKLVTMYNNRFTKTLTPETALFDIEFLRFAVSTIKNYIKYMSDMSVLYNDGTVPRFTNTEDLRILMWSDFATYAETVLQAPTFNEGLVQLDGYREINYWQNAQHKTDISVVPNEATEAVEIKNIVAVLHDRDALGTMRVMEDILTTPVNARARYYNTYWHENQMWANDTSENFVFFTLN